MLIIIIIIIIIMVIYNSRSIDRVVIAHILYQVPGTTIRSNEMINIIGASGMKREAVKRELPLPIVHHTTTSDVFPIRPIGISNS